MKILSINNFLALFLILLLFIQCSEDSPTETAPEIPDVSDVTEITETLDFSNGEAVVEMGNISVIIPQSAANGSTSINIEKLDPVNLPKDELFELHDVYEVSLSSGTHFEEPLTISFKYDLELDYASPLQNKIGGAYYNEEINKWCIYNADVDTINKTITFKTNHLTKLGYFSPKRNLGYTDWKSSTNFNIYWKAGEPMSNTDYKGTNSAIYVGSDPHYIQDILFYLERAYTAYKTAGFSIKPKIDVYVKDLGSDDGNSSFFGYLQINKKQGKPSFSNTTAVADVCAHELLHHVQDYYFMLLFAEYTNKWWLEALAVNAYKFVEPAAVYIDADIYANAGMNENITTTGKMLLSKSWDDFSGLSGEVHYYEAGGFLSYLLWHRTGSTLDLYKLITKTGDANNVSYIRTILDTYINTEFGTSIGDEYAAYLYQAFEQKGAVSIGTMYPSDNLYSAYMIPNVINSGSTSIDNIAAVPYLASRCVKIVNKDANYKELKITAKELENDLTARVYKRTFTNISFVGNLVKSDSIFVLLDSDKEWVDVFVVNKSKDYSKNFNINAEMVQKGKPKIDSIAVVWDDYIPPVAGGSTIKIYGKNFGQEPGILHFGNMQLTENYNGYFVWADKEINLEIPIDAVGNTVIVEDKLKVKSNSYDFSYLSILDYIKHLGNFRIDINTNNNAWIALWPDNVQADLSGGSYSWEEENGSYYNSGTIYISGSKPSEYKISGEFIDEHDRKREGIGAWKKTEVSFSNVPFIEIEPGKCIFKLDHPDVIGTISITYSYLQRNSTTGEFEEKVTTDFKFEQQENGIRIEFNDW